MPGLDTNVVVHKLPLKSEWKPMKQKLRHMRPNMSLKIKEEVKKWFSARFPIVAIYSKWIANIVLILKKDGKVQTCVDYQDLNRASLKDDFLLLHINVLVDNIVRNAIFSFINYFCKYNLVEMDTKDMEKTTFITLWDAFCYKVM